MNTATKSPHKNENDNTPTTKTVVSAVHDAIDQATKKAEPFVQTVRDKAEKAHDKLSETSAEARENIHERVERVEAFIKQRPVASSGIAVAAGIVVAGIAAAIVMRRKG